jgi:LmbE family N-acetylglucosaminyl deacetylase
MIDKIMIVSHPDDEALFGGAELLSHSEEYKVVAIDEYQNDIRRREFLDSMRFIGIHEYEHWTGYKGREDYFREKLIYELLRVLRERKYTKIVTHNTNGEYGHPRHRACHDILAHLRPEKLWVFDRGDLLDDEMVEKKRELLKVYKSQEDVLDWFNWEHEAIRKFK